MSIKINAKEIMEKYPKIDVRGKSKLMVMGDDLIKISLSGKIERVIKAKVIEYNKNNKNWFELEVEESQLIDKGIMEEKR